jgi:DNA-binding NtrC family response regulator
MAEILIIDDDNQIRRLISRILRGVGHSVREAENGREGLELFQALQPALVITDIVMPDMESIATIRTMHGEAPAMPILAISGGSSPTYLRAATELGAMAALEKPFAPDQLLDAVNKLLTGVGGG